MKSCSRCGERKPLSAFYTDHTHRDGHQSRCKECVKELRRHAYLQDPQKSLTANKRWRQSNPEKIAARVRARRIEMIHAYGGRCVCCGETDYEFLTIDHTEGDGAEHRRTVGDGASVIVQYLKKHGWPQEGFRLLCWNCNCARGIHGYCPHERALKAVV